MAAEAAVSQAVQTLGNILVEKVNFLLGVEGKVQWLKKELERMQSFLRDATEKQVTDERVHKWISEIRQLALDSEDAIEIFILKVQNAGRGLPGKLVAFPAQVYYKIKVAEEIESIQRRLQDIESSRLRYGILQDHLREGGASRRRRQENVERRRRLAYWEDDRDVIGLEDDIKLLIEKLAILEERDHDISITTIVGIGGIGKSTLARKIYNDTAIADQFECRAWVAVSSDFTPEDIIKQIMLQLQISLPDDWLKVVESMNDKLRRQQMLQKKLQQHLMGKRYFIVLDDVWEQSDWESLRSSFPYEQDKASRLLVTSRNNDIVKNAQYVHEMKCLGPEDSWNLLLKKTFIDKTGSETWEESENIGKKILERCGGLPLAINVVGGLLSEQKESKSGWENVFRGIDSHLRRSQSSVKAVLELSYQNLAPKLKSCFLFLGLFKEDAAIPAKKMVQVWVALGLVSQEEVGREETMEDVASGYLDELINRNMVQIKATTKDGRVKKCRIHDLLRDLSIEKAKEEINFEILRKEEGCDSSYQPRHRAMYCSEERFINSINRDKHLRSLFVHSDRDVVAHTSSSYLKSCELLKVLDQECGFYRKFPNVIGAAIGLRYLSMKVDIASTQRLPRSFSKLENLQVLNIPKIIIRMPDFMWEKESLRHLKFLGVKTNPHVKIHTSLKNLQTLGYLRLEDPFIEQLTQMPGLRKLGLDLSGMSDVSRLYSTLGKLENLVRLHLCSCRSLNMDGLATLHCIIQLKLKLHITKLPTEFPPNLSYLTLEWTNLEEDPMPVLEKLPKLLHLKLECAYNGEEMVVSQGGFPMLKKLCFHDLKFLSNIRVEEGAMRELQRWEIYWLRRLNLKHLNLPEQLRSKMAYYGSYSCSTRVFATTVI